MSHGFNPEAIAFELETLWAAHSAAGLKGYMSLFSATNQDTWRSKDAGLRFWFGPDEIDKAVSEIAAHYNQGNLPNTTLLLDPVVHTRGSDANYSPVGSGIFWATSLALGIHTLEPEQQQRIQDLNMLNGLFTRGENRRAGLKMLAFAKSALRTTDEQTKATRALYELVNLDSDPYHRFYMLSGLNYLCTHGIFMQPDFRAMMPKDFTPDAIAKHQVEVKPVLDAAECFNAYDRHHSLYQRFGQNPKDIAHNQRFYNLCARDLQLFDATGPMRKGAEESFEFVVPGLVPRGSVTLLAGSGGTGKSSVAHHLCVLGAIDYTGSDERPTWLGQPVNTDICKGICVYFSGEDGPAIINARAELFDPEGKAKRLMFQRTDFGEGVTLGGFLKRLKQMPEVPIMVIDPARKYLTGEEDNSDVVSEFFEAIEEFAISKQCAVIVVHHLQKGAYPQSARQVLDELRGSQVFIDRPRVVIGMFREGKHTVVGLAKNNIPPSLGMVTEERVFVRNPKNLTLMWLPGDAGVRRTDPTEQELEALEMQSFKQSLKN